MNFTRNSQIYLDIFLFFSEYNKIKFIDTSAIIGLNKLVAIHVDHNVCIDQKFLTEGAYEKFLEAVSKNCSDGKTISSADNTNKKNEL